VLRPLVETALPTVVSFRLPLTGRRLGSEGVLLVPGMRDRDWISSSRLDTLGLLGLSIGTLRHSCSAQERLMVMHAAAPGR
jgi:hypothetical protein